MRKLVVLAFGDYNGFTPIMSRQGTLAPSGPKYLTQPLQISREFCGCSQGTQDEDAPRTFQKSQTLSGESTVNKGSLAVLKRNSFWILSLP